MKKILSLIMLSTMYLFASNKIILDISQQSTKLDYKITENNSKQLYTSSDFLGIYGITIKGSYLFDRGIFGTNTSINAGLIIKKGYSLSETYSGNNISYDNILNTIIDNNINIKEHIIENNQGSLLLDTDIWIGTGSGYYLWKQKGNLNNNNMNIYYLELNAGINITAFNKFNYGLEFVYRYGIKNNITYYSLVNNINYKEYLIKFPIMYSVNKKIDIYFIYEKQFQYINFNIPNNINAETNNINLDLGIKYKF